MISIIGSGRVGSVIAFLCATESLDDVILLNRTRSKAIGEAMDISNAVPKTSDITIKGTDDFSDIKNSDIVVISASTATYHQSRTDIIREQTVMIKEIEAKIMKYCPSATILMVSNPLDAMTYIFQNDTKLSRNKVIGVASSLDSSRFLYLLSTKLGIPQSKITDAIVIGEHGDTMVPIFSQVRIDGKSLSDLLTSQEKEAITEEIRNYWKSLRNYKSRSQFGIAKMTFDVIKSILTNSTLEIPASVVLQGEYGIHDIALGVPVTINKDGISKIHEIALDEDEIYLLRKSASTIQNYVKEYSYNK